MQETLTGTVVFMRKDTDCGQKLTVYSPGGHTDRYNTYEKTE